MEMRRLQAAASSGRMAQAMSGVWRRTHGDEAMSGPSDFVITIHALQRMEERFGELVRELSDEEVGRYIHGEVMDAIEAGRKSKLPPLELAPDGHARWLAAKKHGFVVWTDDKLRGYVMQDADEGLLVLTVLSGGGREEKRRRLLVGRGKGRGNQRASKT